ncbi:uncharacterized protein LOC124172298 [Ischnura elegans]|uniref:uncharacterized protein LOC124172298 n=1 Tax=Ischnura elegans TaxID=197161 RepID=UPI001ED86DAB|nr:uncharacterized protein LOC124172298 [Ischnura elegans]
MQELQEKCSSSWESQLLANISNLPERQQEGVRACFAAPQLKNPKNRRYTLSWVHECLLLRIKSRKAYEHLRKNNILRLPGANTLSRYIRNVKGAYGFQGAIFHCLKEKAEGLAAEERRGVVLVDEMKLSKALSFDKKTLKLEGFTNLGAYTPLHQRNERGDHALVLMFQPFRCIVHCISTVLHHIILEGIMLVEQANFYVDAVTCDGAQWNRSMWRRFRIDGENCSCEHPCSQSRRLWFISDFPHLIKNMRNSSFLEMFLGYCFFSCMHYL